MSNVDHFDKTEKNLDHLESDRYNNRHFEGNFVNYLCSVRKFERFFLHLMITKPVYETGFFIYEHNRAYLVKRVGFFYVQK